ncbi:peptidyl-prolyl cis-trans isomerase [Fervidobacterium gondwanense]|uniref:PPIC-type PPIASE domain-containing protein n=1 Tax=Fervidobacterium gondwanense DSM 13020 TaxID=1121883 RepID=A0A1M7SUH7_FERGO|nr:peptidylprolyl isomerase [Fervidobacterium gondwanense]SHN62111.1 PPIC-type PPIASE domain-containing protein [Fervidobacterium gondwanense DSM 13020]
MINLRRVFSFLVLLSVVLFPVIALSVQQSTEVKILGYLEMDGKALEGSQITESDVEDIYQAYLDYYGSFDHIFEEPYVKALVIDQILKDRFIEYLSKKEGLSIEEFEEKHSQITDKDMEEYYDENRAEIMEEQYVDFDYAVFETQEEASSFYELAQKLGFQKALESLPETSTHETDTYEGLKKSETGDAFVDILFGDYENKLRLHSTENGNFVFYIRKLNDLSTFEQFKDSPLYAEVQSNLSQNKFQKYIEEKINSEKVNYVTAKEYEIWVKIVRGIPAEEILNHHIKDVFDSTGNLTTEEPWTISAILTVIEDAKLQDEFSKEYENGIRKLYDLGNKSFLVLARLKQYDNSEKVSIEYNVELSKILISYIENGDTLSVMQYIYNNIMELSNLSDSSNPEIRQTALEYLYKMYEALGDDEAAEVYLEQLKNENPNYEEE